MLEVAALVLPLFSLVLIGFVAGRLAGLPVEALGWLNLFIVYVALPPLFFKLLSTTPVEEFANGAYLLATSGTTFTVFVVCVGMALLLGRRLRIATVQGFAGAYGNIGYLGPPLAIAAFGPAAGVPVALVFCLDNAMHFTFAPLLMALGGEGPRPRLLPMAAGILRKILTHPFILATIAGVAAAFTEFRPPAPAQTVIDTLADAAAPCALFAMGVTAALRPLKRVPVELSWLIPIKLLAHPLLMYALVSRVPGIEPVWLHAAVLMAALPSATNVFVIAQQYGVWEERASSAVVLSTLMSIVSVTGWIYAMRNGWLLSG